jgi:membrane-associated protease RseP (regulator of RpoE activity)
VTDFTPSFPAPPAYEPPDYGPWEPPDRKAFPRPRRIWLHVTLFVLTLASTTFMGGLHYASFLNDFGRHPVELSRGLWVGGLWYSLTILAILGAHEMGHYVACRYYNIDATLPFFIPAPMLLTGTLGAVIRIREPIREKRALFDIGIAGPIAGFVLAIPALFIGLHLSTVVRLPAVAGNLEFFEMGEPLLFKLAAWMTVGSPPAAYSLNLHPMAFAAWFGLLATALNLFPIAQLDGGHISYAVFGKRSTYITFAALAVAVALTTLSMSWIVWTVMIVAMLFVAGPRHPPVQDEGLPLDRTRLWLALFAVVMFALCFTPAPLEPMEFIRH